MPYNVVAIRRDFPILQQRVHNKPLIYLDNSATTQKPQTVIKAIHDYYSHDNANVHRGAYALSERATAMYEKVRTQARDFIHAKNTHEIIFVRGVTDAINLVANSFGRLQLKPQDEVLISTMEHHANIVPWQIICEHTGALLRVIPITSNGEIDKEAYARLLTPRVKIVALTHVSNVLGTINPVKELIAIAHQHNIPVLLDGAQAAPHLAVDVQQLNCDFYAFSAHKMYGPTGIGVLYGKEKWLARMPPYQGGGNMVNEVTFAKTSYRELPYKFEAGTPNIAGVIGLGAAIHYLTQLGMEQIEYYEQELLRYALTALNNIPGLRIIGQSPQRAAVFSFTLPDIHAHDIATILDQEGIAVRAGHHCAMPLMEHLGLAATARASLGIYNTRDEIDALVIALTKVQRIFQ
ncbi:MAG: cysteine desulfurase [Gammaproteobacteria bacterium]